MRKKQKGKSKMHDSSASIELFAVCYMANRDAMHLGENKRICHERNF